MASQRRMHKHGNRKGGDSSALRHPDLTVFGYASKLYEQINATMDGGGDPVVVEEDKYLIPWNGDEQLKIDRYDARLYLTSLDEFNKPKGSSKNKEEEEEESPENLAEKLEEELCEEQRYMDFYMAMKSAEIEEEKRKQAAKKAEIGFNYDQMEQIGAKEEENEKEEEIEPEDDEPFEKPESLKLPVGIVTPDTMRQNALIERTAAFIVSKGPQMEVVIKAKQRQRAEQFDFLDFDHRLHPYYKYLCKLIREKKYTPNLTKTPMRTAKSKPVVRQQNSPESEDNKNGSSDSDESDNDNDNGYLHPLLRGGAGAAAANSPGNGGFIGPEQKPAAQKIQKKNDQPKVEPMPHQMVHSNENSLYSSLMKGLHAVLPKKEEKTATIVDENEKIEEKSPKPAATKANGGEEMQFETDIERIKDYNKWHLEFYGRPSPYLPGPPPIALPPLPDSAVESGITVAAKYVALHGASAEQRLIEHNGDKVHFLLARSRYYTFYQASVRHLQWKLFQQSQKMQHQQQQQISPAPMPPITLIEQISPLPIPQQSNSPSGNVPIEIKAQELPSNQEELASTNLTDKKQQERKEKARLFMERILNERLAEKHKKGATTKESTDGNEPNLEEERRRPKKRRSGFDDSGGVEISTLTEPIAGPSAFSPSQLSKTISSLVDQQLQRTFATSSEGPSTSSNSIKRRKKEKNRKESSESSENDDSGSENDAHRRRNGKREKKRGEDESEDEDDRGENKKGRRRKRRGHRSQRSRKDSRSNERRRHKKSSPRSSSSSRSASSRN